MKNHLKNFDFRLRVGIGSLALLAAPFAVGAVTLLPECATNTSATSTPGLQCGIDTAVQIAKFLFGIMGTAALLMFVIGGFFIVAAGGREGWFKKGKEYVKNAVIGIAIILLSGYAIQYGVNSLRGGVEGTQCNGEYYTLDDQGTQECCAAPNVVTINPNGSFKCGKAAAE